MNDIPKIGDTVQIRQWDDMVMNMGFLLVVIYIQSMRVI